MFNSFSQLKTQEPLSKHCWYALGGPADYFIEAESVYDIPYLIIEAKEQGVPFLVLGSGSNTVFHDEGFRGLVIKTTACQDIEFAEDTNNEFTGEITVDTGVNTTQFVKEIMEKGFTGIESLYGLPGTIGGAVFGNAEAHGTSIGDFVEEVVLLDIHEDDPGKMIKHHVGPEYFEFSYRHSHLHETGETILRVTLKLEKATQENEAQRKKALEALNFRKEKQPAGRNNGSFFKNPEGDYAGRLIDEAGLKGHKIGGAYISEKHGNFFMNDGSATTADLIELKELAQTTVKEKCNINLEPEVRIIMPDGSLLQ